MEALLLRVMRAAPAVALALKTIHEAAQKISRWVASYLPKGSVADTYATVSNRRRYPIKTKAFTHFVHGIPVPCSPY